MTKPADVVEDAVDTLASEKAHERIQAVEERTREDIERVRREERESALEKRLVALETRGTITTPEPPADAGTLADTFARALAEHLAPITARIDAIETRGDVKEKDDDETDPFASQIEASATTRLLRETAPKIRHALFRRIGRN